MSVANPTPIQSPTAQPRRLGLRYKTIDSPINITMLAAQGAIQMWVDAVAIQSKTVAKTIPTSTAAVRIDPPIAWATK